MVGEPAVRVTPRGTIVMRLGVDCSPRPGEKLAFGVVMTGAEAGRLAGELKAGDEVRVLGSVRQVTRRLQSGLIETLFEVVASSVERNK